MPPRGIILSRPERVQKIAQVLREFADARQLFDEMTKITFTLCIKAAPDELAEARAIVHKGISNDQ